MPRNEVGSAVRADHLSVTKSLYLAIDVIPDYSFSGNSLLQPDLNTRISAVAFLEARTVCAAHQVAAVEAKSRGHRLGRGVTPNEFWQILNENRHNLQWKTRLSQNVEFLRVVAVENPWAPVSLPEEAFLGPYDQKWAFNDGAYRLKYLGPKLEAFRASCVPFGHL